MTLQKLPVFVNRYPDGRGTLTCAHCAVDAELDGAHTTSLFTAEGIDFSNARLDKHYTRG